MAAKKEPVETSAYIALSNFFHNSKLLVKGQTIQLTAEDAAPHVAAKLIKPVK